MLSRSTLISEQDTINLVARKVNAATSGYPVSITTEIPATANIYRKNNIVVSYTDGPSLRRTEAAVENITGLIVVPSVDGTRTTFYVQWVDSADSVTIAGTGEDQDRGTLGLPPHPNCDLVHFDIASTLIKRSYSRAALEKAVDYAVSNGADADMFYIEDSLPPFPYIRANHEGFVTNQWLQRINEFLSNSDF